MKLANRLGEARKQIGIVEEKLGDDEPASTMTLSMIDDRLEGIQGALEEADR